jgi:hypothetical protein
MGKRKHSELERCGQQVDVWSRFRPLAHPPCGAKTLVSEWFSSLEGWQILAGG